MNRNLNLKLEREHRHIADWFTNEHNEEKQPSSHSWPGMLTDFGTTVDGTKGWSSTNDVSIEKKTAAVTSNASTHRRRGPG